MLLFIAHWVCGIYLLCKHIYWVCIVWTISKLTTYALYPVFTGVCWVYAAQFVFTGVYWVLPSLSGSQLTTSNMYFHFLALSSFSTVYSVTVRLNYLDPVLCIECCWTNGILINLTLCEAAFLFPLQYCMLCIYVMYTVLAHWPCWALLQCQSI